MNLLQLLSKIEIFIAQWGGTTMPRIVVAFLGILICVWIGIALWEKRIRILGAVVGLTLGLFMVLIAIDPRILRFLVSTSFLARIRILMIILSFLVVVITVEAIRRSHLQERYAILWVTTGLIILVTAFFPHILDFFGFLLGTQYVTSVVGIVFIFLLLIVFHFSIALSGMQKRQAQIAQRCAILETKLEDLSSKVAVLGAGQKSEECRVDEGKALAEPGLSISQSRDDIGGKSGSTRPFTGLQIASSIIIGLSFLAMLITGIISPQAMIGDEVTHYYMLADQSKNLSQPNFYAHIPTAWGGEDLRRYPHSCLWHYLGAVVFRFSGGSFYTVQIYQALFWLQFLWMAFLLARAGRDKDSYAPVLYLLVLASLPVSLIFSVTFYQDVPMTAQVLASFYFLRRRRWLVGTLFLCLGIGFKITALLFLPAYLILMIIWEVKGRGWLQGMINTALAVLILFFFTLTMGQIIKTYAQSEFYPEIKARQLLSKFINPKIQETMIHPPQVKEKKTNPATVNIKNPKPVTPYEVEIIANHPGDLRIFKNYVVYGGVILWIIILTGCISLIFNKAGMNFNLIGNGSPVWLLVVGLSYTLFAAFFLKTAPDARFFLPGVPFFILPFVEKTVRLPKPKVIIAVLSALAVLQAGYVLAKTYKIRHVSSDTWSAIGYLKQNEPSPRTVFMYPEGNYRLFPVPHEWYLNYKLREFWFADNDKRIQMLNQFGIGAVVIKKHLIAEVDPEIINLGVYPAFFVRDLRGDSRFEKVFENDGVIIFKVPSVP